MSDKKYKHMPPEKRAKMEHRDHKVEHCFRWVLHQMERIIAIITLGALLWTLALEVWHMFTVADYFPMPAICSIICWPLWSVWSLSEC